MAEKKRKGTEAADRPKKKSKKAVAIEPDVSSTEKIDATGILNGSKNPTKQEAPPALNLKKSRKRAVDFLSEDENIKPSLPTTDTPTEPNTTEATIDKPTKKTSKKSKKTAAASDSLTADGVNGVLMHKSEEELEATSAKLSTATSLQAEAQRTTDKELEDDFGFGSENERQTQLAANDVDSDADQGAALLAGFDSDASDPGQDTNLDLSRTPALPDYKKTTKKLRKAKEQSSGNEGPGTVYIGRIPHGFYERQMREYFTQFGEISKLRLSRNKRTGASKHFAFIEFASNEVAKIVAETMDSYLMFGHILKCKYAPEASLHPDVWKGANKKYRKIPHEKLEREKLAAPKNEQYWIKKVANEQRKRDKKAKKLAEMGYEMPQSTLTQPNVVLEQRRLEDAAKQLDPTTTDVDAPTGAIEPPNGVPKDVLALKKTDKKEPKSKKDKKSAKATVPDPVTTTTPVIKAPTEHSLAAPAATSVESKTKSTSDSKAKLAGASNTTGAELKTTNKDGVKKSKSKAKGNEVAAATAAAEGKALKGILKKGKGGNSKA